MVIEILGLNSIGIISKHLRWPGHGGDKYWSGVTLIDGSVKLLYTARGLFSTH